MKPKYSFLNYVFLVTVWKIAIAELSPNVDNKSKKKEISEDYMPNTSEFQTSVRADIMTSTNDNSSDNDINETFYDKHNFSQAFLSCQKVMLSDDEYIIWDNLSIYVKLYEMQYYITDYYVGPDGLVVCVPVVHDANYVNRTALTYISEIGLSLSSIFLIMHLIIFALVKEVRNLPGYCLAALSMTLLMAYLLLLFNRFAESIDCLIIGYFTYYFFLCSFFWMNVISFDVWRSLRLQRSQVRLSSKMQSKLLLLYSFYGWGASAFIVVLCRILEVTKSVPVLYRPSFDKFCWFSQRRSLMVFFVIPVFVIMVLNILLFLWSISMIRMATKKTNHDNVPTLKRNFAICLKLAVITGLPWIFGIISGFVNLIFLTYIHVILNSLQGVFIFIVFVSTIKVRHSLKKRLLCCASSETKEPSVVTSYSLSHTQSISIGV